MSEKGVEGAYAKGRIWILGSTLVPWPRRTFVMMPWVPLLGCLAFVTTT